MWTRLQSDTWLYAEPYLSCSIILRSETQAISTTRPRRFQCISVHKGLRIRTKSKPFPYVVRFFADLHRRRQLFAHDAVYRRGGGLPRHGVSGQCVRCVICVLRASAAQPTPEDMLSTRGRSHLMITKHYKALQRITLPGVKEQRFAAFQACPS